jgi:phenylalanine-4-hydroxylase
LEQLDYLQEPDIFHDIFGHIPLLANPVFADYMHVFGQKGLDGLRKGYIDYITPPLLVHG